MSYDTELDYTNEKVDLRLWKRLLGYAARNRRFLIQDVIALIIVAVFDAAYPVLTRYAIDHFVNPGGTPSTEGIWVFAAVYILMVLIQSFFTMMFIMRSGDIEMAMSYDIRQEAFLHLQNLSFSFYDKTSVGYLMARMVSDISRISEMLSWGLIDVFWSLCYVLFAVVAMFTYNWKLALIALAVIPPLAVVSYFLQKAILKHQRAARKQNSRITSAFNEGIIGAMTTKTLVREDANAAEFDAITTDMKSTHRSLSTSIITRWTGFLPTGSRILFPFSPVIMYSFRSVRATG